MSRVDERALLASIVIGLVMTLGVATFAAYMGEWRDERERRAVQSHGVSCDCIYYPAVRGYAAETVCKPEPGL